MINEELTNLYTKHYNLNEIVSCGVIDEKTYINTRPKIVFILKEPNSDEGGWSIPNELSRNITDYYNIAIPLEQRYMNTWEQAGVWAYSILYGFNTYNKLKSDKFVSQGLQAIGMTNLKKTGGGGRAIDREIRYHAKKDKDILIGELKIMEPDLIICGGTYQFVQESLKLNNVELYRCDEKNYWWYSDYHIEKKEWIFLEFCHPQTSQAYGARCKEEILSIFQALILELKKEKPALFSNKIM